jgi:hypothetical protein
LTYLWNNGCTGATCSVSPTTSTTYSVTATSGACSSVAAATTVTVPPTLPAGYVWQGGLTWIQNNSGPWPGKVTAWNFANTYCNNKTANSQTDWRLPTKDELVALFGSDALKDKGWALGAENQKTWASTPAGGSGLYYVVYTTLGYVNFTYGSGNNYVTCVRP